MNILITILIVIAILIAAILIIALFVKKKYGVEREIKINRSRPDVFNYLKFLKNQDNFSFWAMKDPDMKKIYIGIDGTKGFISQWESNDKNVGKGEQEIKNIITDKQLEYEIRFIKPFAGIAAAVMRIDSISENQTTVNWSFKSKMKYPMNIMLLFLNMDKMLGKDLSTGLDNLKTILEKR